MSHPPLSKHGLSKDSEIGQLKTEKASLQGRYDFLAAQSINIIGALTNMSIFTSGTESNRQQLEVLSAQLQATIKALQDYKSLAQTNVDLLASLKSSESRWQILLDGLLIPTESGDYSVTMALTNGIEDVLIMARNIGERAADRVKVDLMFSSSYTNAISVGPGWESQSMLKEDHGRWVPDIDRRHYSIMSQMPLPAGGSSFGCPPIVFTQSVDQPHDYALAILASSGGSKTLAIGCLLHFKPSVQQSSLDSK